MGPLPLPEDRPPAWRALRGNGLHVGGGQRVAHRGQVREEHHRRRRARVAQAWRAQLPREAEERHDAQAEEAQQRGRGEEEGADQKRGGGIVPVGQRLQPLRAARDVVHDVLHHQRVLDQPVVLLADGGRAVVLLVGRAGGRLARLPLPRLARLAARARGVGVRPALAHAGHADAQADASDHKRRVEHKQHDANERERAVQLVLPALQAPPCRRNRLDVADDVHDAPHVGLRRLQLEVVARGGQGFARHRERDGRVRARVEPLDADLVDLLLHVLDHCGDTQLEHGVRVRRLEVALQHGGDAGVRPLHRHDGKAGLASHITGERKPAMHQLLPCPQAGDAEPQFPNHVDGGAQAARGGERREHNML
mmetsp:Transcript_825/g.2069  ORF Transcript_825/g.2069 Transcript_825/m.2069 type:complete len:366 (-) Transcript_825:377-1474(-)